MARIKIISNSIEFSATLDDTPTVQKLLSALPCNATANTWVEVRRSDKQPVFSRMMQTGEAVDLPVLPGMTLSTGNAGGIEIMVNGEVLPPLGPRGAIRRNVALDAESLLKKIGRAQ